MTRKPQRGGYRANAGRPTIDGARDMTKLTVMLDAPTIRKLRALGDGELSAGIRRAAGMLRIARR